MCCRHETIDYLRPTYIYFHSSLVWLGLVWFGLTNGYHWFVAYARTQFAKYQFLMRVLITCHTTTVATIISIELLSKVTNEFRCRRLKHIHLHVTFIQHSMNIKKKEWNLENSIQRCVFVSNWTSSMREENTKMINCKFRCMRTCACVCIDATWFHLNLFRINAINSFFQVN